MGKPFALALRVAAAILVSTAVAYAGPPAGSQIDGWTVTYWHSWWWYAPPAICAHGPLPAYRLVRMSQADMDKLFAKEGSQLENMVGYTLPTPDGFWIEWLAAGLPGPV